MSSRPSPTTTSPMTAPLLKATVNPLLREREEAAAVRELAYVAIFIPIKPESPEKKPPVINAKGT